MSLGNLSETGQLERHETNAKQIGLFTRLARRKPSRVGAMIVGISHSFMDTLPEFNRDL